MSPTIAITVDAVIADLVADRDQQIPPVTTSTAAKITAMRSFGDDSWITRNTISASSAQATSAIAGMSRSPPLRASMTEAINAQTTRAVLKSMFIRNLLQGRIARVAP